jgi:threonine dehydratase
VTRVSAEEIERASTEIDPVFLHTPQYVSEALGEAVGFRPLLKLETLNPVRCFKGRGGSLLGHRAAPGEVLACASAGNFGQGVAYGARAAGLGCVVYSDSTANPAKLDRMRALGADVRLVHGDFDLAKDEVERAAEQEGLRLVVDGREPDITLGAGTIAHEMATHPEPLDAVVVPVGNGSLAWGMSTWLAAASPDTEVIAVSPTGSPMMEHSWRTGELKTFGPVDTIAEGLAARVPVPEAVEGIRATVDRYVLLDDDAFVDAARLLLHRAGVLAEPAGAAALAGAISLGADLAGATVGIPVGGSNVPAGLLGRLVA